MISAVSEIRHTLRASAQAGIRRSRICPRRVVTEWPSRGFSSQNDPDAAEGKGHHDGQGISGGKNESEVEVTERTGEDSPAPPQSTGSSFRKAGAEEKGGDDEHFNQLLSALEQQWPKKTEPKPRQSITSSIKFSDEGILDRPLRGPRGPARKEGMTPKEATTFNELINSILASFPASSSTPPSNPYAATKSGGAGLGFQGWTSADANRLRPMFNRNRDEDVDVEELESLIEEMNLLGTDAELVAWSKNRVFKPVPPPSPDVLEKKVGDEDADETSPSSEPISSATTTPSSQDSTPVSVSSDDLPPMLNFSPVYPKILARTLRALRVHHNSPHLVLALFHHAQFSSLESYLCGCQTGAYNEMLTCRWDSFRDLEGVQAGVREMQVMSVKWDKDTHRLVNRVVEDVTKDLLHGGDERWGPDALETLTQLERRMQTDVIDEENYRRHGQRMRERNREAARAFRENTSRVQSDEGKIY